MSQLSVLAGNFAAVGRLTHTHDPIFMLLQCILSDQIEAVAIRCDVYSINRDTVGEFSISSTHPDRASVVSLPSLHHNHEEGSIPTLS